MSAENPSSANTWSSGDMYDRLNDKALNDAFLELKHRLQGRGLDLEAITVSRHHGGVEKSDRMAVQRGVWHFVDVMEEIAVTVMPS